MTRSSSPTDTPPPKGTGGQRRTLGRLLEGWQPGLLAVFLAGSSAFLAAPRPVEPDFIPEPHPTPESLALVARADARLADAAVATPLDLDVRTLGSAIRAYGRAEADDDGAAVAERRREVAKAAQKAMAQGEHALLRLRAYELRTFLVELSKWESSGRQSSDLVELGGSFVRQAKMSGWQAGSRLRMDETVRATLFKKRWNQLAMVRGATFEPTLDENRALYRFLLEAQPPEAAGSDRAVGDCLHQAFVRDQYRLRKIEELRSIDGAYPADLARGVVLFQMHRYPLAVDAFRKHLEAHPEGPNTIRAQNYLRAALGRASDEG